MRCDVCGCTPCETPGFCESCRRVDADPKVIAERERANAALPPSWESMDVGTLWGLLNHPERTARHHGGDAPQTTYDALVWSLIHDRGWSDRDKRERNTRRLQRLSDRQVTELLEALKRKDCHPDLIADIESFR